MKGFIRKYLGLMLVALAVVVSVATPAFATPVALELPDTGVDLPETINLMVAYMGSVVGLCILAFAAFRVIKIALRWFGKIGG